MTSYNYYFERWICKMEYFLGPLCYKIFLRALRNISLVWWKTCSPPVKVFPVDCPWEWLEMGPFFNQKGALISLLKHCVSLRNNRRNIAIPLGMITAILQRMSPLRVYVCLFFEEETHIHCVSLLRRRDTLCTHISSSKKRCVYTVYTIPKGIVYTYTQSL